MGMPVSCIPIHPWLRTIHLAFVPSAPLSGLLEESIPRLLEAFRRQGHIVQEQPDHRTDLVLTNAPFAEPLNWRHAVLFTVRRRFGLKHTPTILTLIHVPAKTFQHWLDHFERALRKSPPDPKDFSFPGLAEDAWKTLLEQGQRGGPLLALQRMLQAQAKSIRILLLVGDEKPIEAYHFDLVGGYPRSDGSSPEEFYRDIVLRQVTALSTHEVTQHQVVEPPISAETWRSLSTPAAMIHAARELGKRNFFTPTVYINRLVHVPAISDVVADQYSEGCFATWEPALQALISTVTGSARPVDKDSITEDELAVIIGIRPDGQGALVRHVQGKRNDPPSSEAVELMLMDADLPRLRLENGTEAPVIRSKLHGHRGVKAYDPRFVEFVPLDDPYYHFPVTCATEAQAQGIHHAFSRAQALRNPEDPRQVVFTILPGHGVVMAEKWQKDKAPFQLFWEYMDAGYLQIDSRVPQGLFHFDAEGRLVDDFSPR
uniref:Hypothetical conserved protein n=1 Tax=uncultured Chloroflexota bacterium TaxID=166587 RepID=H5SMU8_9CHLR|nr:hypothetical conserved protein [uncultured Chloroflexota bacterium]